jgi:hypothetical protein
MRTRLVVLAMCSTMVLTSTGCAPGTPAVKPAAPVSNADTQRLQRQIDGMDSILGRAFITVRPEPKGDVSDGDFMALVSSVTTGTSPSAVLDFMSQTSVPGTDSHGSNKTKHLQAIPLADSAGIAIPGGDGRFVIVSAAEMGALWKSDLGYRDVPYFAVVGAGEIQALWPVPFP